MALEYLLFAICYAKNENFQIDLEVRGGPGEFFHGQVIIKIGLNFHFLGVTNSPRPPQNLAVLTAVLSTVGGPPCGFSPVDFWRMREMGSFFMTLFLSISNRS